MKRPHGSDRLRVTPISKIRALPSARERDWTAGGHRGPNARIQGEMSARFGPWGLADGWDGCGPGAAHPKVLRECNRGSTGPVGPGQCAWTSNGRLRPRFMQ
jgi:hypothetical protein